MLKLKTYDHQRYLNLKNVSYKLEGKSEIHTTKDEHLEIFPKNH